MAEPIIPFDGELIPFQDQSFDVIFCRQVFEHVLTPEPLLKEIHRVLKINGVFCGSTSYLEPFHSYSIFNITPYGFKTLLERAGFAQIVLAPGVDSISMLVRQVFGKRSIFRRWYTGQSPLNRLIDWYCWLRRFDHTQRNILKLQFCGIFVFECRRI